MCILMFTVDSVVYMRFVFLKIEIKQVTSVEIF